MVDPKAGASKADATFTKFPRLPLEIRRLIWEYAAPNPRHVDGGVTFVTNFELARPRVIIPPWWTFRDKHAGILDSGSSGDGYASVIMQGWGGVFGLLHATHESRNITMETFRLDCPSTLPEDHVPWWDEEDILYIPRNKSATAGFEEDILQWLSGVRDKPFHHFASVKHLALNFSFEVATSLAAYGGYGPVHLANFADLTAFRYRWLQNFPSLVSLSLLFDPVSVGYLDEGSIELYEPLDVVVQQFNRTPSELERVVSGRFEQMAELFGHRLDLPKVECFVMCWRKPKAGQLRWEDYLERSPSPLHAQFV